MLALLLLAGCAAAEFSPEYAALSRSGAQITATVALDKLTTMPDSVRAWLSGLKATLVSAADGAALSLQSAGSDLLSYAESGGVAALISGGEPTYYNVSPTAPAFITEDSLHAALAALYDGIFEPLAAYRKTLYTSTVIRRVGTASQKDVCALPAEDMTAVWQEVCANIESALTAVLPEGSEQYERASALLRSLTFESEAEFSRYVDKDGLTLGMKFVGDIARAGQDARKAQIFFCVKRDKGVNITVQLPAVSGRNTFKLVITSDTTLGKSQNRLETDVTWSRALDGVKTSGAVSVSLKNAFSTGTERWTGTVRVENTAGGVKTVYTVKPDVSVKDGAGGGTATVARKTGSTTTLSGTVTLEIAPDALPTWAKSAQPPTMGEESLTFAAARAGLAVLSALPDADKLAFLHAFGHEEWLESDLAPAINEGDEWLVADEEERK